MFITFLYLKYYLINVIGSNLQIYYFYLIYKYCLKLYHKLFILNNT